MVNCVVLGCSNRSSRKSVSQQAKETEKNQKISFHRFPKDEKFKQKWVEILQISESDIKTDSTICSDHFCEDSFTVRHNFIFLNENVVPNPFISDKKTEFTELAVSPSKIDKSCRLCTSDDFLLTDLYHPRNLEVRKVINLFVNIEDESSMKLPKFICEVCEHIVQSIIDFRDKCKERDIELRGLTESDSKNLIKTEDLTFQSPEKETLPIEVLFIKDDPNESDCLVEYLDDDLKETVEVKITKEEDPDESDCLVEYLDDDLDDESRASPEDEKIPTKNPKPKRDRSKRDWPCLLCKNVYSNWSELNEHKKADHLQCPVCLKTFQSYRLMAHHKTNVHAGDTHCDLCGKHIVNRVNLLKHIRKVHNMERNHKCEICGAAFFFKSKMIIHMSIHNDPNSEICDFENCGKMFKTIDYLKKHKQIHFPMPVTSKLNTKPKTNPMKKSLKPPKTIICQYCGKCLRTNAGYEIHMRVHRNEKPFDCSDCDKKFRDKNSLTVHERIHKNIRPYKCDICPKSFTTKSHLGNHKISIHETEMKHECHICGKRTKIKSNLVLHMKTHGIENTKNDLN